ncbi:hypothetical protein TNCV_176341 [Trichonephila clavipes]|nr:hypothetical protein TNCV_176341 [Trichonephila clavipes]
MYSNPLPEKSSFGARWWLFTRALAETGRHYRSHFSCHRQQRSMETFYKHRTGRYAPHLLIGRKKGTGSRKLILRKVSTKRGTRLPDDC